MREHEPVEVEETSTAPKFQGLRGVSIANSAICLIDGVKGRLSRAANLEYHTFPL